MKKFTKYPKRSKITASSLLPEDLKEAIMDGSHTLDGEATEELWQDYLCEPEEEVNEKYDLFLEPNVQGDFGVMVIYDESGEQDEEIEIDWQSWSEREIDLALSSNTAEEFQKKYEDWILSILKDNGWR